MTVATRAQESVTPSIGMQVPFDDLHEPGAYVCNWSGHLLRMPPDAISPGRSPVVDLRGREVLLATKISDDPFITLTKARLAAADHVYRLTSDSPGRFGAWAAGRTTGRAEPITGKPAPPFSLPFAQSIVPPSGCC